MPILAKEGGSGFTPAPAGTHIARCISVIELGTQPSGNPKFVDSFKILIEWELPEETVLFQGEDKPMKVSKEYSLSLSDKAILRKDLESWRARQFTPEEKAGFDVSKIVGVPCYVTITHKTSGAGRQYAMVSSVSSLTKGTICKPQVHVSTIYQISDGSSSVYQALPDWIKKKIQQSEEFRNPPASHSEAAEIDQLADASLEDDQVPF